MNVRTGLCVAVLAILALPRHGPASAEESFQTGTVFRSGVELLQFDVTVLDRRRHPVRDLSAQDFTVVVDGKVRPVLAFTPVEVPAVDESARATDAAWTKQVSLDVVSNREAQDGRIVALLFDRQIAPDQMPAARRVAHATISALGPVDTAAVLYVGHGTPQGFTRDGRLLRRAIDQPLVGLPEGDAGNPSECHCGTCTLESMAAIAEALQDVPQRRKILLYVGSNITFQGGPILGCDIALKDARERLFRALDQTNVTVHAFDPSGLQTGLIGASSNMSAASASAQRQMRFGSESARQLNLGLLPDRTGGRLVTNTNDPDLSVPGVFNESALFYVLGIERPPTLRGTPAGRLEVRVNRSGVEVTARKTYDVSPLVVDSAVVGATAPPDPLFDALAKSWPRSDLPLSLVLTPFPSPTVRGHAVVLAVVEGASPPANPPVRPPDIHKVDVLVGAFDRNGKALATRRDVADIVPANKPYSIESQLLLPPGRYEVRAAVSDQTLGRQGSVYGFVDVPAFAAAPLALSGIVLSLSPIPAATADSVLAELSPLRPTAQRIFDHTMTPSAFLRAYQDGVAEPMAVRVVARVLDAHDRQVFESETSLQPGAFREGLGVPYHLQLPIRSFPVGELLLSVTAEANGRRVGRALRFTVR